MSSPFLDQFFIRHGATVTPPTTMTMIPTVQPPMVPFFADPLNIMTPDACTYLSRMMSQKYNTPLTVSRKMIATAQARGILPRRHRPGTTRTYVFTLDDLNRLLTDTAFLWSARAGTKRRTPKPPVARIVPKLTQPSFSELVGSGEERVVTTVVPPPTPDVAALCQSILTSVEQLTKTLPEIVRTELRTLMKRQAEAL